MPAQRTSTVSSHTCPVPRVMGYSALFDLNTDEVFTRLDLPIMDPWEVVPYTTVDYPTRDNVSSFTLLVLIVLLIRFIDRTSY